MTTSGYKIENGMFGRRMVLTGPWQPSLTGEVQRQRVVELEANYAQGWKRGDGVGFLEGLPHLQAFEVIDWNIEDVSPIHCLSNLRHLKVSTYCKTAIDFSAFPQLETVSLEWRARAKSIFNSRTLKRVFVNRFSGSDLEPFLEIPTLIDLSVASPKLVELGVPPGRRVLESLGIYNARKLKDLEGIQRLDRLTRLKVNDCGKIGNINPLAALGSLRVLHLCDDGELESLQPVRALGDLRELLFYGTTSIQDGRVDFLLSLGLEKVVFQDRRHYDVKRSAFPAG